MEDGFTQRLLVDRLTRERDQIQRAYDVIKKQRDDYKERIQRLEEDIKDRKVQLVLKKEKYIDGKEGECGCIYDCGGTWHNPNSAKPLFRLLQDKEWIPCHQMIKDLKKINKSQEDKLKRGQTVLREWDQEATARKTLKTLKRALQSCEKRRKSHLPWSDF